MGREKTTLYWNAVMKASGSGWPLLPARWPPLEPETEGAPGEGVNWKHLSLHFNLLTACVQKQFQDVFERARDIKGWLAKVHIRCPCIRNTEAEIYMQTYLRV